MRSYTGSYSAELGILVAAYGHNSNQNHRLYAIVDSLVISDSVYSATIKGLEWLILLPKSYTDVNNRDKLGLSTVEA